MLLLYHNAHLDKIFQMIAKNTALLVYFPFEILHFVVSYQDLLILACGHPENRSSLTSMEEWPEWILEILISNHEVTSRTHITADIGICM